MIYKLKNIFPTQLPSILQHSYLLSLRCHIHYLSAMQLCRKQRDQPIQICSRVSDQSTSVFVFLKIFMLMLRSTEKKLSPHGKQSFTFHGSVHMNIQCDIKRSASQHIIKKKLCMRGGKEYRIAAFQNLRKKTYKLKMNKLLGIIQK